MKIKQHERGQIVVLLALVLVAMLGITAVAVDGATIYSDRRYDQGVADAAALAGAGKIAVAFENNNWRYENLFCNQITNILNNGKQVAIDRAATNSVTLDTDLSDNHGVQVICFDDPTKANGSYKDKYIDVKVMITSEPKTSFAQLVFSGTVKNTVTAVARVRPRTTISYGYAISSMGPGCSKGTGGLVVGGSLEVKIAGAGIFTNTCLDANGSKLVVDVTDPLNQNGVHYITNYLESGSPTINPYPSPGGATIPIRSVPPPECIAGPNTDVTIKVGDPPLNPGTYKSIRMTQSGATLKLNPGLYCITENGITVNGGTFTGDGVTIYLIGGGFDVAGGATVDLSAPTVYTKPALKGMLIYMAESNHSIINLTGNSTSQYYGTIYAPYGDIVVTGNSSTHPTFHTQLIGRRVEVGGNANIDIIFDSGEQFQFPSSLDMLQ